MKKITLAIALSTVLTACQNTQTVESAKPMQASPVDKSRDISRWPEVASPKWQGSNVETKVNAILSKMSTEEKVGQILQAEIQTLQKGDVKKYHLGSVLNGGGSIPYRKKDAKPEDWVRLADELYAESMDTSDGGVAIPILWGTDAVHGHNNVMGATIFPHNMGLGAMRNPELITKIGAVTAKEVRATGIDWVFAPTVAVAQNDLWGRTYESYSESPDIVREYSAAMVKGLQGATQDSDFIHGEHVLACAKHFLGDGGTFGGDDQGDARIDEQTLSSVHGAGYPAAITTGAQTVMSSFSSWNGEKLHGSKYLLTTVLKERMGFDGFVVGDWNGHGQVPGCTNDSCAQSINAGVDLIMVPYDWRAMYDNTLAQVKAGEITMSRLNDAVRRILRVKFRAGMFDGGPSSRIPAQVKSSIGSKEHRAMARQAVKESLVLLKNNDSVLPINPTKNILVAGPGANNISMQSGGWSLTWQGTGTTNEDFPGATSIYKGIAEAVNAAGGKTELSENGEYKSKPDVAIVVFGEQPYAEGHGDRNTLEFEPGVKTSLQLLNKLKQQNIPVVSLFISGRPMWVSPEINKSDAFVAVWLPGSEGAGVADVILATKDGTIKNDFKGLLSFSWPATPLQSEINAPNYSEQPLFKLGYGLSYNNPQKVATLNEKVPGIATPGEGDIHFYAGRTIQPWNIFIRNHERDQILSGAFATLPSGDVKIQTADKDVQEDALRFTWKDAWSARMIIRNGEPLDLERFVEEGLVSFDIKVNSFPKASLNAELMCNEADCRRRVELTDYAKQNIGKGWKSFSFDFSCLKREGDDFSKVIQPFNIDAAGTGEIEIANVKFMQKGEASYDCPKYAEFSTTPMPNKEFWAQDWWPPRHQAVLDRVKQGNVDLLMIGDSITQGWGEVGKPVWDKYYANRNAVNLGFSGDRTEHVLWRLQHGEVEGINPKAVVLMIGTNNTGHRFETPEYTVAGIKAILKVLRSRLPNSKILLLGVFPRDAKPDDSMRLLNKQVNETIKTFDDGEFIHYLNINSVFLTKDGILEPSIMPDLLHLNEQGYELWAKAMEPTLKQWLRQ